MKIAVCIKQVPDTAATLRVKPDKSGIMEDNVKFVVSPYDEFAVEEALRTKDKIPGSDVVAITVGPKKSQEALRNVLAMGCDRAIHVNTDGQAGIDSLAVAKLLAAQLKEEGSELAFTGRHAVDDDNAQVSQMLAEFLSWPHVTVVNKFTLEADNKKARVERPIEGGSKEIWEVDLPAVIAATKGLNEPRYASLKGIMQAKSKPLKEVPVLQAGVPVTELAPKVVWSNYELPPERKAGKVFKDAPEKAVEEVVRLLREEAKVI